MKKTLLIDWCKSNGKEALLYEWSRERNNNIALDSVSSKSTQSVWWKCSTCGYEYESRISTRFQSKKGLCPLCSGRVIVEGKNDFASYRLDLLKEWDYEKMVICFLQGCLKKMARKYGGIVQYVEEVGMRRFMIDTSRVITEVNDIIISL